MKIEDKKIINYIKHKEEDTIIDDIVFLKLDF